MKRAVPMIIKYLYWGVSCGCTVFVLDCLRNFLVGGAESLAPITDDFAGQAVGHMLVGIVCVSTSIVYQSRRLSFSRKVLIHFAVGLGTLYSVSIYLGWIPLHSGQVIYSVLQMLIMFGIFTAIWLGFYLYNHYEAKKINERLRELERDHSGQGE